MKVVLLAHTPTPEQTVAAAARLCYSDTDVEALRESISQEKAEQFVEMLAGFGHESPDRKSTRLNSSHVSESRMPSSA